MQSQIARRFGWKALVAVLLVTVAGFGLIMRTLAEASPEINANRRADPAHFRVGSLNAEAVAEAEAFQEFPLVWLGEEFEGFQLAKFLHKKGDGYDKVYLIYGVCESPPGALEPSCVPPLAVVINAPRNVPSPNQVEERVAGPETTRRGVTARILSGSMFLWTGGVVISVKANSEHMEMAIAELETVNHEARNEEPLGKEDDLTALGTR